MRMNSIETFEATLASNSLEITSLILDGREQNQPNFTKNKLQTLLVAPALKSVQIIKADKISVLWPYHKLF